MNTGHTMLPHRSHSTFVAARWLLCIAFALALVGCGGAAKPVLPPLFYPPPPADPRIQLLATFTTDSDVTGKTGSFRKFLLGEEKESKIGKAYGVAIHDGKIFVCDAGGGYVWILDIDKKEVAGLGFKPPAKLSHPVNIAVDKDGTRYIADTGHRRVMIYDAQDQYVKALGDPKAWRPVDVAIRGELLYVTDLDNAQVVVLRKGSGEEVKRLSTKGSGPDQLFQPTNVALDGAGNVYVSDTGNFRVLKFGEDGTLVSQIGKLGRQPGQFVRPRGIAVDREQRLYVVDAAFENVQVFDKESKLLMFFAGPGFDRGNINLPAQVTIDYDNIGVFADRVAKGYRIEYLILVVSQYGPNKVNVYGFITPEKVP